MGIPWHSVQWGSAAAWVSGLATSTSVGYLAVTRTGDNKRSHALQARLIRVRNSLAGIPLQDEGFGEDPEDKTLELVIVDVTNLSNAAVVDLEIVVPLPSGLDDGDGNIVTLLGIEQRDILAPAETWTTEFETAADIDDMPEIVVSFTDAQGRAWHKLPRGEPTLRNLNQGKRRWPRIGRSRT